MFKDTPHFKKSANILKALGNSYRLQIVSLLLNGELNVSTLNESVKVSQPALSQHLAKLRKEGIVGSRRQQRQIFYYITNPQVQRLLGVTADMAAGAAEAKRKTA